MEIADRRPEIKNIETENVANIRVAIEEVMVGVLRNPAQGKDINYYVVRTLLFHVLLLEGFCMR